MSQTRRKSEIGRSQAAFLIRCWREVRTWRYAVEEVASRRRRSYANVEELLTALREQMPDSEAEITDE